MKGAEINGLKQREIDCISYIFNSLEKFLKTKSLNYKNKPGRRVK
jgi:hypothetical protein